MAFQVKIIDNIFRTGTDVTEVTGPLPEQISSNGFEAVLGCGASQFYTEQNILGQLPALGGAIDKNINLNFGAMTSEQTTVICVWNTHSQVASNITLTLNDGSTNGVILTPLTPFTVDPLNGSDVYCFEVKVLATGSTFLNEQLTITSSTGESFTIPITAIRANIPILSCHDWSAPLVEGFEYLTDVTRSFDGTEVRHKLRSIPRRTITTDVSLIDEATYSTLYHHMVQSHDVIYRDCSQCVKLIQPALVGQTQLQVNRDVSTVLRESNVIQLTGINAGGQVVVRAMFAQWLTSNIINLSEPLDFDFDIGSPVDLLYACTLKDRSAFRYSTDSFSNNILSFNILNETYENTVGTQGVDYVTLTTDNELEIMNIEHNWVSELIQEVEPFVIDFDPAVHQKWVTPRRDFGDLVIRKKITLCGPDARLLFRRFLNRLAGRWCEVMIPTDTNDMVADNIPGTYHGIDLGGFFLIKGSGWDKYFNSGKACEILQIISRKHGKFYAQVISAFSNDPRDTTIEIQPVANLNPLLQNYNPSWQLPADDLCKVSLCHIVRLEDDNQNITSTTNEFSTVDMDFRVIHKRFAQFSGNIAPIVQIGFSNDTGITFSEADLQANATTIEETSATGIQSIVDPGSADLNTTAFNVQSTSNIEVTGGLV